MYSDLSEDLWALMGRVHDLTKNIPSQKSPIIARDVYFSVSQAGD